MTQPAAGTILSHFRLIELLGRGAMGEVWLAEDTQLPRKLAIKFLAPHLAADEDAVQRMVREAAATASVDHPAVATVYETGSLGGRPYLVMQHFEGETLEDRLQRGPLEIDESLGLARDVADALAEVHALGIVHRDLKPANIMLTERGPRILDFGLASVQASPQLTDHGTSLGTPMTMSPEQVRGELPDNRSDLWSLGVILYRALTGRSPFEGDNRAVLFQKILNEQPASPGSLRSGIDPDLDHVVSKLLRKEPAHRYPRAEDLLADLVCCVAQREPDAADAHTVVIPAARDERTRLAVVPFEVMSADPDDRYLAGGLVEDLIVDLARVERLHVPSRAEVAPYAERSVPPRTLARELGVDFVLLGSVRRLGNRGRISAQLVRAGDGHTLWAERYDRTLEDLFAIQEEVSREIVSALQIALRPEEDAMLQRAPTTHTEAYTPYLRARELTDNSRESNLRAERLLKTALQIDPGFALAHAALAQCYVTRPLRWWAGLEMAELAQQSVRRALELEPDLPDAVQVDLLVKLLGQDEEATVAAIGRVMEVMPDDEGAREWAAWAYMSMNRPREAAEILETQTHRYQSISYLRNCYQMLGRDEDAHRMSLLLREILIKRIERDPEALHERSLLAGTLISLGDTEGALVQAERAVALDPMDGRARYNAACAYSMVGELDRSAEHLREAVKNLPSFLAEWPHNDPDLAPVRKHPAWKEIFAKAAEGR